MPAGDIEISLDTVEHIGPLDAARLERLVEHVLDGERVAWRMIGVILSGHARIRELNSKFLGHDYETDVLSFLIEATDDGIEGEVYVDVETAAERHAEFGATIHEEIERYVVHGLLHLAGYNDDTPEAKKRMHDLESMYLQRDS